MNPLPLTLEAAEQAMHWQLELQAPDVTEQTRAAIHAAVEVAKRPF